MTLPGKAAPVKGSVGLPSVPQPEPLKSPLRSARVGTVPERTVPRFSRFHSCERKKCSLSFMIGPLKV